MQTAAETREQRSARLAARVAELRAQADAKQAEADRIHSAVNGDSAFWTQPAYGNPGGRAFSRQRDRERSKLLRAAGIADHAKSLRQQADVMESRGAVMAGDAEAERVRKIEACSVEVGQIVDTTHYGLRKVVKVNRNTVLVEGSFGPLKVEKQFLRLAA